MAWELLAMWAIVIVTLIWFVRDEKRLRAEADIERASRYYAHAAKYRHLTPERAAEPIPAPSLRTGGLSSEQRAFIAAFTAPKASTSR